MPAKDDAGHSTVLGGDLGIEQLTVTATGMFWSGGFLTHRRREYERNRDSLQQTGAESAHRTIDQMETRETRWVEDYLHRRSKAIVQEAIAHDCDTIAFEELTGIRERLPTAERFHAWAFRRLYDYVAYKTNATGIDTTRVDPAYTSQRCSRCGTTFAENRPSQAQFCGQNCGYAIHGDYNAAENNGMNRLRGGQTSPSGGASSHLALTSGTVTVNGDDSPADA